MKILLLSFATIYTLFSSAQTIQLVKEFSGVNAINYLTNFNGKIYFSANDGSNGQELWASDGSTSGTILVKDIISGATGSNPEFLKVCGTKLYFIAKDPTISNRKALYVSDGTSAGTIKIITLSSNNNGITANNYYHFYNGKVYFKHDGDNQGFELWSTDGTVAGTGLVANIYPGSGSSNPDFFIEYAGKLFFSAEDDINGKELWSTSGTSGTTTLVSPGNVDNTQFGPRFMTLYHNKIYYEYDGELWSCNGGSASLFLQINPDFKSDPKDFYIFDDNLFFSAKRNGIAHELFVTDGTTSWTQPVLENMNGYFATKFSSAFGKLFFSGHSDIEGQELWISQGDSTNTELFQNINIDNQGPTDGILAESEFININDTLFLSASDNGSNLDLFYLSNGNPSITKIEYSQATNLDGKIKNLTSFQNNLFFLANYTSNQGLYRLGQGTTTAINQVLNDVVKLYPNPVFSTLTVEHKMDLLITIKSIDGRIIYSTFSQNNIQHIDVENLASGSYLVEFNNANNELIKTVKIIKN